MKPYYVIQHATRHEYLCHRVYQNALSKSYEPHKRVYPAYRRCDAFRNLGHVHDRPVRRRVFSNDVTKAARYLCRKSVEAGARLAKQLDDGYYRIVQVTPVLAQKLRPISGII